MDLLPPCSGEGVLAYARLGCFPFLSNTRVSTPGVGTALKRLLVDVYGSDVALIAEYVVDFEPLGCAVLDEQDGAGWDFLNALLTRRSGANALTAHRFLQS